MHKSVIRLILLICIILNCMTIFWFSNQNAETSGGSSGRVVNFITNMIPSLKNMEEQERIRIQKEIMQPIVRKLAHFSIYTLLGIFTMSFAKTCRATTYQKGLATFLFGFLYASSDEIHQLFIAR